MNHYCKEYRDDCEGCQPALMDPKTGEKMADDSPEMVAVRTYWKTVPLANKQACHRVWCFNSRTDEDMRLCQEVSLGMQAALKS